MSTVKVGSERVPKKGPGEYWKGGIGSYTLDPTRSTGRCDLLLNEKKMWVDFQILDNPSPRRNNFSLESPLTFCCYFIKGKT